jgi:hypothetical protein
MGTEGADEQKKTIENDYHSPYNNTALIKRDPI